MAFLFVYPIKYPWQVITHIFLQGAPQALIPPEYPSDYGIRFTIGHLGYNLLLILPFGILVEKIIGTKKMLPIFVASWLIDLIACIIMGVYFTKKGEEFGCHGASGLAFCFVPSNKSFRGRSTLHDYSPFGYNYRSDIYCRLSKDD